MSDVSIAHMPLACHFILHAPFSLPIARFFLSISRVSQRGPGATVSDSDMGPVLMKLPPSLEGLYSFWCVVG
jgi:hypothetical protein